MVGKEEITTVGDGLLIRAPAKINLSLLIAGKRPDGFHEIETVMAKIDLFDEILIEHGQERGIELVCAGPYWAPQGRDNLVYQACELLLESRRSSADIKITLIKNAPAGSGLGSASSDAAATLVGINKLLQFSLPREKLSELAARLGSDVSFFLNGPLAFCTGRGEKVKKLDENFDFLALLILPDVSVSTKEVYAHYKHDSALHEKLSAQIDSHIQKNRIDLVWEMCANMLQKSCLSLYEELAELKAKIESLGIGPLSLSGSGSAMFFIINGRNKQRADEYRHKLKQEAGCKSVIVSNNRW
jgi:4-diphosphocytidyl-2-C-methyl-D-erythritol kinase